MCVQPKNTPDKSYEPYNTNSKNTVNDDSEPKNYLFYLVKNVMDYFSHSAFVVHEFAKNRSVATLKVHSVNIVSFVGIERLLSFLNRS